MIFVLLSFSWGDIIPQPKPFKGEGVDISSQAQVTVHHCLEVKQEFEAAGYITPPVRNREKCMRARSRMLNPSPHLAQSLGNGATQSGLDPVKSINISK